MVVVIGLIILVYAIIILWLYLGFNKTKQPTNQSISNTYNEFSVIIPFRNEEKNLPNLLNSLSKLNYPNIKYNIIFVNDDSDDDSVQCIESFFKDKNDFNFRIIENHRKSNSPKKDALQTAIELTTTEWIISTDADCIVPANWLLIFNENINNYNPKMICGSVLYQCKNNLWEQFQLFDLLSLQGVTIGSFGHQKAFMCNGANLAYQKSFFNQLNGFNNNDNLASGDDVFLLQKAVAIEPENVHYILNKEHTVYTYPEKNWTALLNQRIRWAAKSTQYIQHHAKFIGVIVLLTNLSFIASILNYLNTASIWYLMLISLKIIIDYSFIIKTAIALNLKLFRYNHLLISLLIYPFFSSYVGCYALFGKFEWKGRAYKK